MVAPPAYLVGFVQLATFLYCRWPALIDAGVRSDYKAVFYPIAAFTRSGVIGVSRRRTPVRAATALLIAGETSGVPI